jgi:hypothetical protein
MRETSSKSSTSRAKCCTCRPHQLACAFPHLPVVGQAQDLHRVADGRQRVAKLVRQHGEELVLASVGLAQGIQRLLALVLGLAHAQQRAHVRHQLLGLDGRADVAVGAGVQRGHAMLSVHVRGRRLQHDDLGGGGSLLDPARELAAVQVWQAHVQQDQRGHALGDELHGRGAGRGLDDLVSGQPQDAAFHITRGVVVVDVEDELAHGREAERWIASRVRASVSTEMSFFCTMARAWGESLLRSASSISCEVTTTTGMPAVSGSAARRSSTSPPFMPGMERSRKMTSGRVLAAAARPVAPSPASSKRMEPRTERRIT